MLKSESGGLCAKGKFLKTNIKSMHIMRKLWNKKSKNDCCDWLKKWNCR